LTGEQKCRKADDADEHMKWGIVKTTEADNVDEHMKRESVKGHGGPINRHLRVSWLILIIDDWEPGIRKGCPYI